MCHLEGPGGTAWFVRSGGITPQQDILHSQGLFPCLREQGTQKLLVRPWVQRFAELIVHRDFFFNSAEFGPSDETLIL